MLSNPRSVTLRALLEWERGRSFSDDILHAQLSSGSLSAPDRALVMELFYGVLRNLSQLDFFIGQLREGNIDPETRTLLRLGLYQIFHTRIAPHAAVNETVALGGRTRGVVNAVLRRALRERDKLEVALAEAPPAVRTSHPEFLIERWNEQFGPEATEKLCAWDNSPADVYVRANGLKVTPGELLRSADDAEPSSTHPHALKVKKIPLSWIVQGLCYVQDPSTLMACDLLAPRPRETVLDACAAPGGKTTYLAELMHNSGRIVACDLFESRVERLRHNLHRLGVRNTQALHLDVLSAAGVAPLTPDTFDRILIDAPCSNTGVLRRRVDVRWRLTDEDFIRMPITQLALVRKLAPLLKQGGTLVYSTCSLESEENDRVVEQILADVPRLRFIESCRTLPFKDSVDGAFAAKFERVD
ncbi:16S rRNA (cytosine(967)-C(5))-methyltransferase RsmB [Verrucomicrobiota bacterium sgz303538]